MEIQCQELLYKKNSMALQNECKVMLYKMSETIDELLKRRLRELDISQSDLAKKIGVSRAYIGSLVNRSANTQSGFYRPKPELVSKMAAALKVSEIDILNAIGYTSEKTNADSHEILDGATVSFDERKFTKAEQKRLLDIMRTLAAGVKAEKEKEEK